MTKRLFCIMFAVLLTLAAGCGEKNGNDTNGFSSPSCETEKEAILSQYTHLFDEETKALVTADFLNWMEASFRSDSVLNLYDSLKNGTYTADTWHAVTGNTITVLKDSYSGALNPDSPNYRSDIKVINDGDDTAVIRVTGDLSLADNWHIMQAMDERGKGLSGVMEPEVTELLKGADITLTNNEFTLSTRGKPLENKYYTFRGDPERVKLYDEMGVDIVSVANNHAYDYGPDAFADTLDTLKNADIAYIGGGEDLDEAKKPFYFIVNGRKIAFTAATKAEIYRLTPEATDTTSGVLRTYDPDKYLEVIKKAKSESDYVIAYVHWGTENSHEIADDLPPMGAQFIDAGADIVIGAHAHVLQGIGYYDGKPIVYNLGNFLFNEKTMDSGILELNIAGSGDVGFRFIPLIQSDCYVKTVDSDESARILEFMTELSQNVRFEADGTFTEVK